MGQRQGTSNRKKHGVHFRTAAKVLLDPYVIEFHDLDAPGELRFNAIGLVDVRMLFVNYAMEGAMLSARSARGAEPHEKGKYRRFKLDPKKPPKSDWRAFDAMTEEERQAALSE